MLPDGTKLTRADLPPADTDRWVARRKAAVVAAVDNGLIEANEACKMYRLSDEELDNWRAAVRKHGAGARSASPPSRSIDNLEESLYLTHSRNRSLTNPRLRVGRFWRGPGR